MRTRLFTAGIGLVLLAVLGIAAFRFFTRSRTPPEPARTAEASSSPGTAASLPPGAFPFLATPTLPTTPETILPFRATLCPASWPGQEDTDGDGLPNAVEAQYHTDEGNPDTDGDGYADGDEVQKGYHPLQKEGNSYLDSDWDGLREHEECAWKTDLLTADTDGDGYSDGDEVKHGFDPTLRGDGRGSDRLSLRTPLPTSTPTRTIPLPEVQRSELIIVPRSTPANIRAYQVAFGQASPSELVTSTILSDAFTRAFQYGQTDGLVRLRASLRQAEENLLRVPTPERAVPYHREVIALLRFVRDSIGVIEQNLKDKNLEAAETAVREMITVSKESLHILAQLQQDLLQASEEVPR